MHCVQGCVHSSYDFWSTVYPHLYWNQAKIITLYFVGVSQIKTSAFYHQCIDSDPVSYPTQHYRAPMFLDNLTSSMQSAAAASTSSALVSSSSSHYDASTHTASSIHETRVITGGGGASTGGVDTSISDIISLDWAMSYQNQMLSGLFSTFFLVEAKRIPLCEILVPYLIYEIYSTLHTWIKKRVSIGDGERSGSYMLAMFDKWLGIQWHKGKFPKWLS